ncbi:hypothetical protein MBM_06982 [Drepanopeziza brunnea f. sp. 'multigermtubi' MB_m1]|uniref:Uncharacterized protein n=1 Tax=Marssonina brunnea f. sp. multigermtubi (strain MB_m1) TaxID=1072389 RepID=K1WP90_MARBU|nr:uncharacterized protein MBM_06982 [Drepanopeziza brunnea f. sp. 'multigermtubi' MB_m1]EKD14771.1 hypothetical protein MBM_06982 [Drepanopeziza brunnea f. sp. 'multigermtubi' MB_m1]
MRAPLLAKSAKHTLRLLKHKYLIRRMRMLDVDSFFGSVLRLKRAYQIKDSIAFLREFAMQERDVNDLKNYYRTFSRVSERLTLMHLLSKTEQGRLFFFGLLVGIRNKTIKHSINREKSLLANFTKDIRTLVKEHTELASVLESAKKALVVIPFTREPRFTSEKKEINKSLTQLPDALFNPNFKFDSKTATKPLLNIPLKMLEVKSASKEEFRLLLSATDYKDEEKEEVEDTGARCKIVASARTPKTQLKLFINTRMSYQPDQNVQQLTNQPKEPTTILKRLVDIKNINAIRWINTLSYSSSIEVASVEINAAAKDKAKKPF